MLQAHPSASTTSANEQPRLTMRKAINAASRSVDMPEKHWRPLERTINGGCGTGASSADLFIAGGSDDFAVRYVAVPSGAAAAQTFVSNARRDRKRFKVRRQTTASVRYTVERSLSLF
jgi:hypothetical protein